MYFPKVQKETTYKNKQNVEGREKQDADGRVRAGQNKQSVTRNVFKAVKSEKLKIKPLKVVVKALPENKSK